MFTRNVILFLLETIPPIPIGLIEPSRRLPFHKHPRKKASPHLIHQNDLRDKQTSNRASRIRRGCRGK